MVKRTIGGFFLLVLLMWILAPKHELYYLLEKELKKQGVVISNETIENNWFGVTLTNANISVKGIQFATVKELNLNLFFLYNTLTVKSINIDESLQNMAPKTIDRLNIVYSIMNPLAVQIDSNGSFGIANGTVDPIERHVKILFPVAKDINTFKKFLKKDASGWYYETNY